MIKRILLGLFAVIVAAVLGGTAFLAWQGTRPPDTTGEYVALGSSFAAGIGLGERAPGSPLACMRTGGGYPARVAATTGMRLVNMSCSGSTSAHILDGGQVFQGPQLAAVGPGTQLVTITTGGNDVGYIGDLTIAAGNMGRIGKWLSDKPKPADARDYALVTANLEKIVAAVRKRAPGARVVIVNYPAVLPPAGNCPALRIDDRQAALSREVAARLLAATNLAASRSGAILVDAAAASAGHDACSARPWVHGGKTEAGAPFHPNGAGAAAVAGMVALALGDGAQ